MDEKELNENIENIESQNQNLQDSNQQQELPVTNGRVLTLPLVSEIKTSYLNYAMSVIVGRALPDARDGLKPVQRRVLFAMSELGIKHNSAYKKSARIVGETMGKYHPHGDSAIYETMARLAQDWTLRYKLVDGQGNFGSIDGDKPAAMRYTEARLSWLGELMLANIDENTIDWAPNFDESLKEPLSLPSILPNLIVNGSTGIAVGMATNIPPHNLREVVNVLCWLIENEIEPENADLKDILEIMPGPDFPTGGEILGTSGIREAYSTGRGKIVVRGKMHVEETKRGRLHVIVTEIPYNVNKTALIENMVEAAQNKQIEGVSDIRDESDRDGMRIVVELMRDTDPDLIMRQLYKHTQLQTTFGVINLALNNQRPEILSINQMFGLFLNYRREVVRRRTEFRLKQAQAREHIVEGLLKALNDIDSVIKIIRSASTANEAKENLQKELAFTEAQSSAILEMRLQRLTGLERGKLEDEKSKLLSEIAYLKQILDSKKVLDGVIHDELQDLGTRFGDDRRTSIIENYQELADEDIIPQADIVITLSKDGFIKRKDLTEYKIQARGGKGRKGATIHEDDSIASVCVANTHRDIYFFTNTGRVMSVRGYTIPETKSGKGKQASRVIPLNAEENERIVSIASDSSEDFNFAFFITINGIAKRAKLEELKSTNRPKKIISLDEGDEIARVLLTTGNNDLLLVTAQAQALRVSENEFRPMLRTARGIRAMNLSEGDKIISCDIVDENRSMLVLSEFGIGKRVNFQTFTPHHRATSGIRIMVLNDKTGKLIASHAVSDFDELISITSRGRMIRIPVKQISIFGRSAVGNHIVRLDEGDTVADCSIVKIDESTINDESQENLTGNLPFESNESNPENFEPESIL